MIPRTLRILSHALIAASGNALAFGYISPYVQVIEYVNEITGHYVLLSDYPEIGTVDRGAAGPGWRRTGHQFYGFWSQQFGEPVCRFYSPRYNSHFFTVDAAECASLRAPGGDWIFEKTPFRATPAGDGCKGYEKPVFRLYNNRHMFGDANHRFTGDPATRAGMLAMGWVDEGIAFCANGPTIVPERSFEVAARSVEAKESCERRVGACVALEQLAPMPNLIYLFFPPFYVVRNEQFPFASRDVTGIGIDLRTALPPGDNALIVERSFLQMYGTGSWPYAIHIRGADRLSGDYASISPMYELPGMAPPPGAADERVFPWKDPRDRVLVLGFELSVKTVRRSDPSSHAYGLPVLQFADAKSGRSFLVTIQAFGTQPPGDFVAPDAKTGWAIVSTSFREKPAFGERLNGDYVMCDAQSGRACLEGPVPYRFLMRRADLQEAIDRARAIDPALSTNPGDYFLASYRFHSEVYRDAEMGMYVQRLAVDIYY